MDGNWNSKFSFKLQTNIGIINNARKIKREIGFSLQKMKEKSFPRAYCLDSVSPSLYKPCLSATSPPI